jgi:hypothetical protein
MKFKLEIVGTRPLLMHNPQGANPLNPITKEKKALTSKRKKDDSDIERIMELDYASGCYFSDDMGFYIPTEMVEAAIKEGAKINKNGGKAALAVSVEEDRVKLIYGEKDFKSIKEAYSDQDHVDVRFVNINNAKVVACRPRFNRWRFSCTVNLDTTMMTQDEFINALQFAGVKGGIGTYRQKYGKFEVKCEQLSN